MNPMNHVFADRMDRIPESFIREILKVATTPNVISFAGGLPNPITFPVDKMAAAAEKIITREGKTVFQYAPTEGYPPLRDYLAQLQSKREGIKIDPEEILILNGSQQGLDLAGKLFCNKEQNILLEEPSYLGAIQAFSAYEPMFHSVALGENGPDLTEFNSITRKVKPKFFYCIPNFQNPTGCCYSTAQRLALIDAQFHSNMLWIEDNPYGEIFFNEERSPDFHSLIPEKTISLGSFSKIISPGIRLGWATGPQHIIRKMAVAKQASDLHSGNLAQRIVYQFLCDNPLDVHLNRIRNFYKGQADTMEGLIRQYFPKEVSWIEPKGGMFLWVKLPAEVSAVSLLDEAMRQGVIFVPGENFFLDKSKGTSTLRLNFSNPSKDEMKTGMEVLGKILTRMITAPS
jgi:2-aminoadipate transaminase